MAIARGMAESGSTGFVNGFDKKVLVARRKNLIDLECDAEPALFDATDGAVVESFLSSITAPAYIFVNNVTLRLRKPLSEISPEAFSDVVEVNLTSVDVASSTFVIDLRCKALKDP